MASDAQREAVRRYKAKNERLDLMLSGVTKSELKAHAAKQSESVTGFINRAIKETMQRDEESPSLNLGKKD